MRQPFILNNFNTSRINTLFQMIAIKTKIAIPVINGLHSVKVVFSILNEKLKLNLNTNLTEKDIYILNKNFETIFKNI